MSLFGSLTGAAKALDAQRYALDVIGQNIANLNTPGYSRREVLLTSVAPGDALSAGGGVAIQGLRAVRDALVERRVLQEKPEEKREAALSEALSLVETALGAPGKSLDQSMTLFFDAFSKLAEDPLSATARQEVVLRGTTLSADFRDMNERMLVAQRDANVRMRAAVDDINAGATRIAALNTALFTAQSNPGAAAVLRDELGAEIDKLSDLVGIEVIARGDGGVDISFAGGRALVTGQNVQTVSAVPQAPNGFVDIQTGGVSVTSAITNGKLGGFRHARDVAIPGYVSELDTIAFTLVTQVNTLHDAGFDRNGVDAPVFFNTIAAAPGAAAALTINAAVVADPNLVAAASVAATPGNNTQARALAEIRNARVLSSNTATLHDAWGNLSYRVGSDASSARFEQRTRADIVRQVENLRDAAAGVSMDEEAMKMLKFQRAYEANARFFRTIDEALDVLLSLKR